MDYKSSVRLKIRERLDAGTLPRTIPPLATPAGMPSGHLKFETSIAAVRCAACDDPGAQVSLRFPDGRILRFHGRCHKMWEEEVQR